MFAHVVTFRAPASALEGIGMQGFQERVVPVLRELPGLQGHLILLDREQGELLGVTLWDSEDHARVAGTRLEQERETGVDEMGATSTPGRIYAVLSQAPRPA